MQNASDGDIAAALAGIRNRLDTLASISPENILIPGGPQERYHQLVAEAYAALGLIETQVDALRAELEYHHQRLDARKGGSIRRGDRAAGVERFTTVQVFIGVLLAITTAVIGIIGLILTRRQMQRTLLIDVEKTVRQLPRIPDDQGGWMAAPVHLFIIQAVNSGLLAVTLKDAGILFSDGKFLTKAFSPRHDKQFPLELAQGNDHEAHVDVYDVLHAIKGTGITGGKVIVRGYFKTSLKQYKSKKVHLNMEKLANDIERTEGAWRKNA